MIRTISICQYCKKQTICSDDGDGMLTFDFVNNKIIFYCNCCNKENIINFGSIEQLLQQKSKIPRIGSYK